MTKKPMKKPNPAHTYDDQRLSYEMLQAALSGMAAKLTATERRLDKVDALHGGLAKWCDECAKLNPCPTRQASGDWVSGVDPDINIPWPGPK